MRCHWLGLAVVLVIGCTPTSKPEPPPSVPGTGGRPAPRPTQPDGGADAEVATPVTPEPGIEAGVPMSKRAVPLARVAACSDITSTLVSKAIANMNAELDRARSQAQASARLPCQPVWDAAAGSPMAGAPSGPGGGASSYSGTNNQVAGVDEADFIKNDGKYLYVATGQDFRIVEAWPAASARVIAKVTMPGAPEKLFVHGDRAVVFSRLGGAPLNSPCTYAYDCVPRGDGRSWNITVYDITDRAHPVLLRELKTSSSFIAARRVGNAVHTMMVKEAAPPSYSTWPTGLATCGGNASDAEIAAAFERLRSENVAKLQALTWKDQLPALTDTLYPRGGMATTTENLLVGCDSFYQESGPAGRAFTSLVSIDLATPEPPSVATIFSNPGIVYASADALYLAVRQAQDGQSWYPGWEAASELTTVHKFRLAGAKAAFVASGAVKGRVLSQFALDEHEGRLRIATSTGHLPSPDVHSTVSVLGEAGENSLGQLGQIDRLAPGEDIRSVRFDGARGYLVTFKKTDPLFVLDLADGSKPKVEAELKIPGFSTYMHRMDETHLLTIGYDAADQGDFAYFTGVLLQIFDVADAKAPKLVHKHVIGTRGSSSEALTNHLAFTYFPPKQVLLLPMTVCEAAGTADGGANIFTGQPTFSGLIAFDTTLTAGFKERGRVPFGTAGVSCGNWWTNASSVVRRSVVMDDVVFSITGTTIKASTLGALDKPLATVSLSD